MLRDQSHRRMLPTKREATNGSEHYEQVLRDMEASERLRIARSHPSAASTSSASQRLDSDVSLQTDQEPNEHPLSHRGGVTDRRPQESPNGQTTEVKTPDIWCYQTNRQVSDTLEIEQGLSLYSPPVASVDQSSLRFAHQQLTHFGAMLGSTVCGNCHELCPTCRTLLTLITCDIHADLSRVGRFTEATDSRPELSWRAFEAGHPCDKAIHRTNGEVHIMSSDESAFRLKNGGLISLLCVENDTDLSERMFLEKVGRRVPGIFQMGSLPVIAIGFGLRDPSEEDIHWVSKTEGGHWMMTRETMSEQTGIWDDSDVDKLTQADVVVRSVEIAKRLAETGTVRIVNAS